MISFISNWAQGVIVAVIIASIIEMIIPNGSSKKYIKMVVGVFILFTIITPVINKFTSSKIEIESSLSLDKYKSLKEVSANNLELNNNFNIKQIYESNLKVDIKSRIRSKGFETGEINVKISDNDEFVIEFIEIKIVGEKLNQNEKKANRNNVIGIVDTIEKVSIDISGKEKNKETDYQISEKNANILKEYISTIYDLDINNITVN